MIASGNAKRSARVSAAPASEFGHDRKAHTMSDARPPLDMDEMRRHSAELIDGLRRSGAVPGIKVGDLAPVFSLPDAHGRAVHLADRLESGPVVLAFYRGAWCPVCNTAFTGLQAALPRFTELGASLVTVSPQRPDDSLAFVRKLSLGFDVLSDAAQETIRAYNLQFELSDELKAMYPLLGMDLTQQNADGSWNLPVPATFVIDQERVVRAAHVDPDYRNRMVPDDIVAALQALR
ncbi:MAG: peroxiredoxin-like family protein [Acidimicrobiales bacterium]